MKLKLETVANIGVLVVCTLLSAVLVQRLMFTESPAAGQRGPRPTYQVGENVSELSNVIGPRATNTLVMYISPSCRFCTESMPFYQELSAKRHGLSYSLVAVGREPAGAITDYLAKHNVAVDKVVSTGPDIAKLAGTPTLILIDGSNKAAGVWRGLLQEAVAREVVDRLSEIGGE